MATLDFESQTRAESGPLAELEAGLARQSSIQLRPTDPSEPDWPPRRVTEDERVS